MLTALLAAAALPVTVQQPFLQAGILGGFALISLTFYGAVWREDRKQIRELTAALAEVHKDYAAELRAVHTDTREKVIPLFAQTQAALLEVLSVLRQR